MMVDGLLSRRKRPASIGGVDDHRMAARQAHSCQTFEAFHLLKELDFGSVPDSKLRQAGEIIFEEFGDGPGNSSTWVNLKDDLTVSLLQARLIKLNLHINVEVTGSLANAA